MNKIKFAAGAAIVAIAAAFTACSSDEDIKGVSYTDKDVVQVTADVSDMTTRGSFTTASLRQFGMSINNSASNTYCYDNVYVKYSTSLNAWDPAQQMRWQNDATPVDIVAYAPYNDTIYDNIAKAKEFPVAVPLVQTEESNDADFLLFKSAGFVPKDSLKDGKVHVSFKHAMSLINVKVNFGGELEQTEKLAENPVTKFAVGGTVHTGICDFTAEAPKVVSQNKAQDGSISEIEGYYVSNSFTAGTATARPSARFSCIVIPQYSDNFRLVFAIGDRTFTWRTPSPVTFEPGKRYSLELNAGKDLVLISNGINITPWEEADEQDLKTD